MPYIDALYSITGPEIAAKNSTCDGCIRGDGKKKHSSRVINSMSDFLAGFSLHERGHKCRGAHPRTWKYSKPKRSVSLTGLNMRMGGNMG
jgi:hypothetical protein